MVSKHFHQLSYQFATRNQISYVPSNELKKWNFLQVTVHYKTMWILQ